MPSDVDVKEKALADLRDSLVGLREVPAAALAGDQHELLVDAIDNVQALETALTHETEQLRDGGDDGAE